MLLWEEVRLELELELEEEGLFCRTCNCWVVAEEGGSEKSKSRYGGEGEEGGWIWTIEGRDVSKDQSWWLNKKVGIEGRIVGSDGREVL